MFGSALTRGRIGVAGGGALTFLMLAASGARAESCASGGFPFTAIGSGPASIVSMIGTTITTENTAFLLQSTAFVASPANPAPAQQGGGIWARSVGGNLDVKSSTNSVGSITPSPTFPAGATGSIACSQQVNETFAGVQLGSDIAKLNIYGWNMHVGTTAGILETRGSLVGGAAAFTDPFTLTAAGGGPFTSSTDIPFIGGFAVATYGGFAVDALLRTEFYQNSLTAPGENLFGQNVDAHGISFSSSMSYQWLMPNTKWFIEPSAGVILSRVKVDPINGVSAGGPGDQTAGTIQLNDVKSDIGRIGLRFGTTIDAGKVIWQPFGVISVWHEFGPDITATGITCPGCATLNGANITSTGTSATTNFGTYEQYSLGVSATLAGSGWLGYVRVDYRDGSDLQGLSGTGGVRYQFTPEASPMSGVMPVKELVRKGPIAQAVNWTGFYVGIFGGGAEGTADWDYAGGGVSPRIGGYELGGEIGYNYQVDRWVLGVEADLEKTSAHGGIACGPLAIPVTPLFEMTCNASANWIGTVTGRVGYTWDRALFYLKGGSAWTKEQFSATCNVIMGCTNPAGAPSTGLTNTTDRGGWVIGYGSEFALTRSWFAKAEYDYISFSDRNVVASDGSVLNVGMHISEAKVGVNYRFDAGPVFDKP